MAGKKKSDEKEPHEHVEGREEQDEAKFQEMEARLEKTIDSRFERFEKALEKYFAPPEPAPQKRKAAKRPAPAQVNTHDTRNKALRTKYNPVSQSDADVLIENEDEECEIQDFDSPAKSDPPQNPPRPTSRKTGSRGTKIVNKDGGPQENASGLHAEAQRGPKTDINNWLINHRSFAASASTSRPQPMSARDFYNDETLDPHVQNIIATSASAIARGNAKFGFFPSKYVLRGLDLKPAPINSLSISEHCWAIFRMIHDIEVPQDIKPHLLVHIEQILEDTQEYDWQSVVRPWSNAVFSRIAEGRIAGGWSARTEIQNLRMTIAQASTARLATKELPNPPRAHNTGHTNDNLRGGPPCVNFNSQKGCSLPSGHIQNGKKLIHICAFCLFDSATARPHPEFFCRNKQRQNSTQYF